MAPVWLITGCSSGIGRELARAALERGHRVALSARDPSRLADLAGAHPERALALELDVTDAGQVARAVAEVERRFGRIDVLVNNAGYGYLAAIEEGEDAELRALFDTNFFGLVAMTKAVLPGMRVRRAGHLINVSSMAGLVANPGTGYYSASKFAVEGLSEALSRELAPFGIRVTAIEPGAFRTDWAGRSMRRTRTPLEAYAPTVGARVEMIAGLDGRQPGDPRRAAEAILRVAELPDPPLHLLLGRDVVDAFRAKLAELARSLGEWEQVSLDVGFRDAPEPEPGGRP
jgi:NAD(P)-dependent dehydrogenase (short-subunit alcohol dehydrogenase family)